MNITCIVLGILFLIPSVLFRIFPLFMMTLGEKWRSKDATPTEPALGIAEVVSLLGIIAGILLTVYGIFEVQILAFLGVSQPGAPDLSAPEIIVGFLD